MNLGFTWHLPVAVRFGAGCVNALPAQLGERGCIVLAFDGATASGLQRAWQVLLGDRLLDWVTVPRGLPTLQRLHELAPRVWDTLEVHADAVLIGLGGGSVMDLAKLLRWHPADGEPGRGAEAVVQAWRSGRPEPRMRRASLWLVPTTAGTGSEVLPWATVWDTASGVALRRQIEPVDAQRCWADQAWVDPLLSATCPRETMRDAALDALGRALEAIWTLDANPTSDRLALGAARQIIGALPEAWAEPADPAWRSELALASLHAGMAYAQTRSTLIPTLAQPLALERGLTAGQACAIWLPSAWRLALGVHPRVDRLLGAIFRSDPADGARLLEQWLMALDVDPTPSLHAVDDAPRRVACALASARGRRFITGLSRLGLEAS